MAYELGTRLRRLREARGISRQRLHELADVSTTYIAQIELGEDPRTKLPPQPSPETLRKLARGLEPDDESAAERCYQDLMAAAGYLPAAEGEAGRTVVIAARRAAPEGFLAAAAAADFAPPEPEVALEQASEPAMPLPDERLWRHLPGVLAAWPRMAEDERVMLVTILRWLDEKYARGGR